MEIGSSSPAPSVSSSAPSSAPAPAAAPSPAPSVSSAPTPTRDRATISSDATSPSSGPSGASGLLGGLNSTYGGGGDLRVRDGWTDRNFGDRKPGISDPTLRAAADVGDGAIRRADQFRNEWKSDPGSAVANVGKDASDIYKGAVGTTMDAVDGQLKGLPGNSVTQPVADFTRGALNGLAGTPEAVGQMVGKPGETLSNVGNLVQNPGLAVDAFNKRVEKNGTANAIGETVSDVWGLKGIHKMGNLGDIAKAGKDVGDIGNAVANDLK